MSQISIKRASIIYGGAKYSTIIFNLILSAILSRLLTPYDYGVVAIVAVFTSLFSVISNLGIGPAVIYYKDMKEEQLQDVFNFSMAFSFALMAVFIILAYPISLVYKDRVYIPITLLLSAAVFFNAANMVPNSVLLRDKKFLLVGIRMIVSTAVSGVIAAAAAFMGAKYYALVIQSVLSAAVNFFWNMKGSGLRFGIKFKKESIDIVKGYSIYQFGFNICNYIMQNLDNMLVGAAMGSEQLGYYNKGYTLSRYPVNNIGYVVTPVLQPILTDYKNDRKKIYDKFVELVKIMSLIGVFLSVVCVWGGRELILCYFGSQWEDAAALFMIMSFGMWSQLVNTMYGSIYQSIGCTSQMFKSGLLFTVCSAAAIILGIYLDSIIALAVLVTVCTYVKFFSETYFLIKKSFGCSVLSFLKNLIPDLIIACILAAIVLAVGEINTPNLFLSLIIKCIIVAVPYLICIVIFKQSRYLLPILPKRFRGKKEQQ